MVESQMPPTVIKAAALAKIQQQQAERTKLKNKFAGSYRQFNQPKQDLKTVQQTTISWKDRQLRDYRKANGLCFSCGEKFVPRHMAVKQGPS